MPRIDRGAASAARIASAVRIGRPVMAAPLAQARRQTPPFARNRLGGASRAPRCRTSAKQVAPDPDIRANHRPGRSAKPREHGLDLRHQRDRRRLEIVAALPPIAERAVIDAVPSANTSAVVSCTRGLTSNTGAPESSDKIDRAQLVARALATRRQAQQARRHVASELGRDPSACFGSIRHR